MERAHLVQDIVHDCSIPIQNAQEIARSLEIATTVFFGPD